MLGLVKKDPALKLIHGFAIQTRETFFISFFYLLQTLQIMIRQRLQDLPHINSRHNIDKRYKISLIQD